MDDTEDAPGEPPNIDAPRLKKIIKTKTKREMRGLTASVVLLDRLDDLVSSLKKDGIRRPDLLDEAIVDLLVKYKVVI